MLESDVATVQALRLDVAVQVSRHVARMGMSQSAAARHLRIPQPTLSKIVNGRVADLSVELLLRVAVRARMPITLMTGRTPQEAGAYVSTLDALGQDAPRSKLAELPRDSVRRAQDQLTPSQRLDAFLEHNQHIAELRKPIGASVEPKHGRRSRP